MPTIKAIEVRLEVADVQRSAQFYADILEFEIGMVWPEESPEFAILQRDGLRLQLGKRESSAEFPFPGCTLCLDVAGVMELHAAIKQKIAIDWGPEVYFYHRREFAFKDPDGHAIIASEPTSDPITCIEEP